MTWPAVFVALLVSHLTGDFLAQTDWQASHKFGGLGRGAVARRALGTHVLTYTAAFVPVLWWIAINTSAARAVLLGALISAEHLVQDDGRLLMSYIRRVKHAERRPGDNVFVGVDQTVHLLTLFVVALLAVA